MVGYSYVNSNQEIFPWRQIFCFPTSQGYIKASCKSFLGSVAMYVYKVVGINYKLMEHESQTIFFFKKNLDRFNIVHNCLDKIITTHQFSQLLAFGLLTSN